MSACHSSTGSSSAAILRIPSEASRYITALTPCIHVFNAPHHVATESIVSEQHLTPAHTSPTCITALKHIYNACSIHQGQETLDHATTESLDPRTKRTKENCACNERGREQEF